MIIFGVNVLKLLDYTLFPVPVKSGVLNGASGVPLDVRMSVNFFRSLSQNSTLQIVGNIALFVPFGFGLWWVRDGLRTGSVLAMGFTASLTIEIFQLVLGYLTFPLRTFDVLDLVLNVLGVVLGILIFHALVAAWHRLASTVGEPHMGRWLSTFDEVVRRAAPPRAS